MYAYQARQDLRWLRAEPAVVCSGYLAGRQRVKLQDRPRRYHKPVRQRKNEISVYVDP
jgi:hypothetical protein